MSGFVGVVPYSNDAVAGTVVQAKATQAFLYGLRLVNTTDAAAYLQVFAKPSAGVTLGTTTPDFFVRLEANESLYLHFDTPVIPTLGIGLSLAGTTTAGGATGAAISVTAFYQ